jgi:2,4-dienoyl-CoA reductase-like NADH-dependent reductase (Old Yellow Enzyme family)
LLFTPLRLRGVELKNRIMISPMAIYSAVEGVMNDFHFAHLGRFALGGAGTVIVEATAVTREGRITNGDTGLWDDGQIAPMRRVTEFLRTQGVVPGVQLAHAGRKGSMQRPWDGSGALTAENIAAGEQVWQPVGPTAEPMDVGHLTPRMLSEADLARLTDDWVAAAGRAQAAGFDWLEIHNAHGYLVHQFLSPLSNTRTDRYGGDFEGRVRWPLQLAAALREAWPADRPVSLRISAVDGDALGWQMADSVEYARRLKALGIDLVCTSSGGLKGSATNARVKRDYGYQVPYAAEVKRETGIGTIAVGLILDPHHAERILRAGEADLIAIGREALVNPSWPQMAEVALGRPMGEALDDWPHQYGWWLKFRERILEGLR